MLLAGQVNMAGRDVAVAVDFTGIPGLFLFSRDLMLDGSAAGTRFNPDGTVSLDIRLPGMTVSGVCIGGESIRRIRMVRPPGRMRHGVAKLALHWDGDPVLRLTANGCSLLNVRRKRLNR